jgi:hypothetical protein
LLDPFAKVGIRHAELLTISKKIHSLRIKIL